MVGTNVRERMKENVIANITVTAGFAVNTFTVTYNGNGNSGGTVINITVAGNEFSARDFAKKLQPELNRLVGFGTV